MNKFVMYELDKTGLRTLMTGEKSLRYADRYRVNGIDFTDNSKKFISNMKADSGIYINDIITLNGDVTYIREDGLEIRSKRMMYNTKTSLASTNDDYTASMGENRMKGSSIAYNSAVKKVESKNVIVKYNLKEGKE